MKSINGIYETKDVCAAYGTAKVKLFVVGTLATLLFVGGVQADDLPINTNGIKHENVVIRGAQLFNGCSPKL